MIATMVMLSGIALGLFVCLFGLIVDQMVVDESARIIRNQEQEWEAEEAAKMVVLVTKPWPVARRRREERKARQAVIAKTPIRDSKGRFVKRTKAA